MEMTRQAELCSLLAERLRECVILRDKLSQENRILQAGYDFSVSSGAGKYQIKADITHLRRELQRLNDMIERS